MTPVMPGFFMRKPDSKTQDEIFVPSMRNDIIDMLFLTT